MTEDTAPEVTKIVIRPKLDHYVRAKSAGGKRSHRIDDVTARTLAGKDLDTIKKGADLLGIDHTKWSHVNHGQQRMLIGNAIRHRLNAKESPLSEQALADVFGPPAPEYDAEAEARAKAEKEAARAAAKAEKEKAKAEKAARAAEAAKEEPAEAPKPTRGRKKADVASE